MTASLIVNWTDVHAKMAYSCEIDKNTRVVVTSVQFDEETYSIEHELIRSVDYIDNIIWEFLLVFVVKFFCLFACCALFVCLFFCFPQICDRATKSLWECPVVDLRLNQPIFPNVCRSLQENIYTRVQLSPAISNSVISKSPKLFRNQVEFLWIYPYVFSHLPSAISNSELPAILNCCFFP